MKIDETTYEQMLVEYFKLFGMAQFNAEMCASAVVISKVKLENLILVQCNIK